MNVCDATYLSFRSLKTAKSELVMGLYKTFVPFSLDHVNAVYFSTPLKNFRQLEHIQIRFTKQFPRFGVIFLPANDGLISSAYSQL